MTKRDFVKGFKEAIKQEGKMPKLSAIIFFKKYAPMGLKEAKELVDKAFDGEDPASYIWERLKPIIKAAKIGIELTIQEHDTYKCRCRPDHINIPSTWFPCGNKEGCTRKLHSHTVITRKTTLYDKEM